MSDRQVPSPPPPLPPEAHKGTAGRVLCLAGSETMPGAALLVIRAAQRAGAGLVTLASFDRALIHAAAVSAPEAVHLDLSRSRDLIAGRLPGQLAGRADHARVAGPGLGRGGRTDELVRRLVNDDHEGALVLDADGLGVVEGAPEVLATCRGPLVLTPHPGEAARLLACDSIGQDPQERIEAARTLARASSGLCVLKGHGTVVTDGERVFVCGTGNPGMATAGAGDVLAGILGAYLAQVDSYPVEGWGPFEATCAAVHVHGLAGDLAAARLGRRAVTATAITDHLCLAQQQFEGEARG